MKQMSFQLSEVAVLFLHFTLCLDVSYHHWLHAYGVDYTLCKWHIWGGKRRRLQGKDTGAADMGGTEN